MILCGLLKAILLAGYLLLLAPGGWVFAQALPPLPYSLPEGEAPPALFSAQIGDAEVDFVLAGSWRVEVAAALGLVITPSGAVYVDAFPSFGASGAVFRNYPRLSFSVWLEQRYFVEASFIGDFTESQSQAFNYFDENYLLAGYRGMEGEFLRSVLIGNREVAVDPYPFLEVPETGSSSLGASALFGAGRSSHQLLLRYDNNEPAEAIFLGKNRVEESTLRLDEYIRGRFFRLPDEDVQDLEVYLEDATGSFSDGTRRYRRATVDDALLDAAGGIVTLKKAAVGAVLVYYRVGFDEVGDPGLGIDALPRDAIGKIDPSPPPPPYVAFDWSLAGYLGQNMNDRRVTVGTKDCLRLWKPGEFSPFEILGAYPTPGTVPAEASRMRVQVLAKGDPDTAVSSGVRFRLTPGTDYLTAYRSDDLRGDLRNLVPFLDDGNLGLEDLFDPDNLLYGPSADPSPGYLRHELRVSLLTPVTVYGLGADVVPGSVQVLRNGVAENRFELDAGLGVVSFLTEIAPDDRLVITFRRRQSLAGNGDLLFVWGNTIPLGDAHTLQVATGLRWNAVPGGYTEEAYTRTGSALVSAGLQGEAGPLRYEVSAAAGFTNPDTTGRMRLLGMEGQGREIPLSESTAWPAAPPVNPNVAPFVRAPSNRGLLYYKDLPYETGSKPGPYVASENLVLDFDLGSGEWVGTQVPVSPGQGLADLSGLESVSMRYRATGASLTDSFQAYLQIGEIGEDLDADGVLDEEASASSAGFLFNDNSAGGGILRVGSNADNQGNGRRDSEDVDGNGTLDPEDSGINPYLLVPLDTGNITAADTGWLAVSHPFDATERSRLSRVRSLRLLVVQTAGTPTGARFEVERISLEGSLFHGTGVTSVREIEEWASEDPPPAELEEAFPEVADTFHPYREVQKVLEVEWPAGAWQVRGYTQAATEGIDYRRVVYYYRLPTDPGGTDLRFSLLDESGKGLHWTMPTTASVSNAWSRIEVSLDDMEVYRNGTAVVGATVSADAGRGSLSVFTVGQTAASSGSLYLDEVHLTDPKSAVGAAARGRLELELPGTLVAWGGHPVLHDLTLRQEGEAGTRGFAALYGTPQADSSLSSRTELSVGISVVDLDADLQVAASGSEVSLAGGHRLALPIAPLAFEDAFSLRQGPAGLDLARGNRLSASLARVAALRLEAEAISQEGLLTQSWSADLDVTPWVLDLQHRLSLTETRSGYEVPEQDYFSNWIGAYSLIAPWNGGAVEERLGKVDVAWGLGTRPLAVRLAGSYNTRSADFLTAGRTQTSMLSLEASLPLVFVRQEVALLSLTPGYRRVVQLVERPGAEGNLGLDLTEGLAQLASQGYWYRAAPLDELFSAATASQFAEQSFSALTAVYTPEVFLTMSRFTSSRLYDLVLPASLELSLNRELRREGVLVGSRNNYRLSLQSRALNLFGALGAYPLFPFYRTDEASGSLQLTATEAEGVMEKLTLLAGQYLACDGESAQLTLENRFAYTYEDSAVWSDTAGALLVWERHPLDGVRVPLLPTAVGAQGFWSHEESLSTSVAGGEPAEDASTIHPFNLVLAHRTSLVLPEFGYLKGGVSLGLDAEKVSGEGMYWRIGLKASLEAQIQF